MFMRHPQSGPIRRVSEQAFELIWKRKGWEQVDEQEATAAAVDAAVQPTVTGPGTDYEALTIPQLEHAATVRPDVDLAGATRKGDIIARFVDADDAATEAAAAAVDAGQE